MRQSFVSSAARSLAPLVLLAACVRTPLVESPAPEPATIDAPLDVVARAAREELILRHIAFDLADTSSVALVSAPMRMDFQPDEGLVDCGARTGHGYAYYRASLTPDGQRTRLAPKLVFSRRSLGGPLGEVPPEEAELGRCPSRQVWESDFAFAVKARAEGHPLTIGVYIDPAAKPYTAAVDVSAHYYANASSCHAIEKLETGVRLYFANEDEARRQGLRRSPEKGC